MTRQLVPLSLMRGGTSRGVAFRIENVPAEGVERDAFALRVFSGVDGLGGGTATTNKIVLVGTANDPTGDLEYIVGNVTAAGDAVDWSGTCGNMTAAVVPFALAEGLITPVGNTVILQNLATGGFVEVHTTKGTEVDPAEAEFELWMRYPSPGGSMLGSIFPTNAPYDRYDVEGHTIDGSLVDITHPYLLLRYQDVVAGPACPSTEELRIIEHIRGTVAHRLRLAESPAEASQKSPAAPRVVLIKDRTADSVEITAISMGQTIASVPVTAAFAVAGALRLGGTVLGDDSDSGEWDVLRVRGASSTIEVGVEQDTEGKISAVSVKGTARTLLRGTAAI
ncbi:MAG: hypothetical protein EOP24_38545 [Hyphomicrobiales bacterium]|nr:MAG: hypothetical protein EOP24_38545 [Hyphomicrobiales bacterium]